MEKHFLITVSDNTSALHGIRFAGHFFSNKDAVRITLFYTVPKGPQLWAGEKDLESVQDAELQEKQNKSRGRRALDIAKKELIGLGFKTELIRTKLLPRRFSTVLDILREGADGLYDSVILGRRGLTWIEEAFDQSVSRGVLDHRVDFPLWVVRNPDLNRSDVLLCVDGTQPSKHMVDHVGFILAGEKTHKVTLFFVNRPPLKSQAELGAIFDEAVEILEHNEFPKEMIKTKVVEDTNPAKAIVNEAGTHAYAVVAVGRRAPKQGIFKKMFFGSVSMRLFRDLEKTALWICY